MLIDIIGTWVMSPESVPSMFLDPRTTLSMLLSRLATTFSSFKNIKGLMLIFRVGRPLPVGMVGMESGAVLRALMLKGGQVGWPFLLGRAGPFSKGL